MSAVIEFASAGMMTEAEYDARREVLRAAYGDSAPERSGRFDQELARLFESSRWTQEQLALKEGKNQSWIARRLHFARFLNSMPTGIIPKNLTEWRFRGYWEQTDPKAKDDPRFQHVQRLIVEKTSLNEDRANNKYKALAAMILDRFGDGIWHYESTIVKETAASPEAVARVLENIRVKHTRGAFCERVKGGKEGWKHRIVVGVGKKIDVGLVVKELSPFIKDLEKEGRKDQLLLSPGVPAMMAIRLTEILEKLTQLSLPSSRKQRERSNE